MLLLVLSSVRPTAASGRGARDKEESALVTVPRPTTSRPVGLPVLCAAVCGNSRDDGADATLLFMLPPSQKTSLSTLGRLVVTILPPSSSASLLASLPNTTLTYWRVGVAADAFPRFRSFRSEASMGSICKFRFRVAWDLVRGAALDSSTSFLVSLAFLVLVAAPSFPAAAAPGASPAGTFWYRTFNGHIAEDGSEPSYGG